MPARKEDIPSTLERSPKKVQDTYEKALDSAHEQYDSEERAHRTAWSAVKHVAEKKGDHWEPKDESGPSDEQSALSGRAVREGRGESHGKSTRPSPSRSCTRTPSGRASEGVRRCPSTSWSAS